jgi:PAS domain S-box-containing protein
MGTNTSPNPLIRSAAEDQCVYQERPGTPGKSLVSSRLELLSRIVSRLLVTDRPQAIIDDLCREMMQFLGCQVFFNYILDPPTGRLHLNACGGVTRETAALIEWLEPGRAVCGCVLRDGHRIVAEDIPIHPDPRTELVGSMGIVAYACHPLLSGGRTIGTLSFGSRSRTHFPPDDLALMKTVSDHIAIAVDRMMTQDRLREGEQRFRELAESLPQLVWTCTPKGRCEYLSRQWLEYTGADEVSQLDYGWLSQVHPDDQNGVMAAWEHSLVTGTAFRIEFRILGADGRYRWFDTRAVPVRDGDGRILRWFGSNTDVSERKSAEEARKQLLDAERAARNAAERANRSKDEFLATISHELRTPLQAILGWTTLLARRTVDEQAAEGIQVIARNAHAQVRLIEDLLDMSRLMSGKMRIERRPVDLAQVVVNALESVRPAARARRIELTSHIQPPACGFQGDAGRLQQVVWNLLSNAIKFTPEEGRVSVTVAPEGKNVCVRVCDTGQGMKPEFVPCLFDRFRQENASTTRRFGGLGLGLSIVRHLVELHGGTVTASSDGEGKGSTFEVRLPCGDEPPASPVAAAPAVPAPRAGGDNGEMALRGVRVLIVEDQDDSRELLRCFLEDTGATVTAVASAAEALDAFDRHQPDVLVSDIGMPEMDGYELMTRIRRRPAEQGGAVPAVALTAFARPEDMERVTTAGFHLHLAKPADPIEVVHAIAGLARGAGPAGRSPAPITSPAARAADEVVKPMTETAPATGCLRILLVEDYHEIAQMMQLLLESYGHRVTMVSTVAEAISMVDARLAAGDPFDLVLSDLALPDGSGLQLARELTTRPAAPGRYLRAIAISGYDDREYIRASLQAGFSAHLVKPVEENDLIGAIRRVFEGDPAGPAARP